MQKLVVIDKNGRKKMVNVPSWDAGYFVSAVSSYNDVAYTLAPIVYLDSGRTDSYSGTGTIWKNISGSSSYNATLTGSGGSYATYTTSSNGLLTFNPSSSQYATTPDLGTLNNFTVTTWCKFYTPPNAGVNAIVTNKINGGTNINYAIGTIKPSSNLIYGGYYNNAWITSSVGITVNTGSWYNFTVTYDGSVLKFYVNGQLTSSNSSSTAASSSGLGINIAKRWDTSAITDFISASVPVVAIYNKALTDTNIADIYSQFKIRYNF